MKVFAAFFFLWIFAALFGRATISALQQHQPASSRRQAFKLVATSASLAFVPRVLALDMDSFVNSQLASDTTNCDPKRDPKCIPKLSGDEALCKYGQSGNARAEACQRVRASGGTVAKPTAVRSMGGAYAQ